MSLQISTKVSRINNNQIRRSRTQTSCEKQQRITKGVPAPLNPWVEHPSARLRTPMDFLQLDTIQLVQNSVGESDYSSDDRRLVMTA